MSSSTGNANNAGSDRRIPDVQVLKPFLQFMNSYSQDLIFAPARRLYHYTDLNGLYGIVQNHDLWLTHSRYSNDEQEMELGYSTAEAAIEEARKVRKDDEWLKYLDCIADLLKTPDRAPVYICCFCLEDNLLSQWRSYGANGTGVSIEIETKAFDSVTGPDSPPGGLMRLWKVIYEEVDQKNILRQALDFAFNDLTLPTVEERAERAVIAIEFFIPTFKNADFREEQECRLIFTPQTDFSRQPKFRVARGMLVPYFSLRELFQELVSQSPNPADQPLERLPIKGVCIGPSVHRELNVESTKRLLTHAGYPVEVHASATPYRG